ncbi:MAG: hypothetical protein Q9181_001452 [Wetmoreana brouardii]
MADPPDTNADENSSPSASLLVQSTKSATYLILLQIGSRTLTFLVNQILLRFLSPELLGISTQLELYSVTVLFFARESLRVALQRQNHEATTAPIQAEGKPRKHVPQPNIQDRTAQEVVNISYIAIGLGLPLAFALATLYIRTADTAVLQTPFINHTLNIYTLATVLELFSEPCFALAQLQMLYGVRASAETLATLARCLLTCGTAVWASKAHVNLGVLPFAIGQIGYASVLNVVYLKQIAPFSARKTFSIFVRPIVPSSPSLILDRFLRSRLSLAFNIYAQSLFKHLLTTGDALLIAAFTSLQTQGVYTLAANYGGLVARMVFQPIEESSRSLFGRLLHHPASESSDDDDFDSNPQRGKQVDQAAMYIRVLLRFYSIASVIVAAVGPTLAPLVLRLIAGSRWSESDAPFVLAAYCYYIPLLAINGILEAFVSAAASPEELRVQSAWMVAFSAAFAGTGFLVLKSASNACTNPSSTGLTTACWTELKMNDFFTNWTDHTVMPNAPMIGTIVCKTNEVWAQCFLRFAYGQQRKAAAPADCSTFSSTSCQSPSDMMVKPTSAQYWYGAYAIYAIFTYINALSTALLSATAHPGALQSAYTSANAGGGAATASNPVDAVLFYLLFLNGFTDQDTAFVAYMRQVPYTGNFTGATTDPPSEDVLYRNMVGVLEKRLETVMAGLDQFEALVGSQGTWIAPVQSSAAFVKAWTQTPGSITTA